MGSLWNPKPEPMGPSTGGALHTSSAVRRLPCRPDLTQVKKSVLMSVALSRPLTSDCNCNCNCSSDGFQLYQLGLHLAHLLRHGVQVVAHEAVFLRNLVAHDQMHDRLHDRLHEWAHHRPAFPRCLQKNEVMDGARKRYQHDCKCQPGQHQLPALKLQHARAMLPWGMNDPHR